VRVLVVAADASAACIAQVEVEEGAPVREALALAAGAEPALASQLQPDSVVGVWGRPVSRDHALRAGDRVEIYRRIHADAKALRRARASLSSSPRRRSVS
jgi:putative ubiquitin-RnfH superfamily antitoxin RatB of RatAB toxin-antitoxin module